MGKLNKIDLKNKKEESVMEKISECSEKTRQMIHGSKTYFRSVRNKRKLMNEP